MWTQKQYHRAYNWSQTDKTSQHKSTNYHPAEGGGVERPQQNKTKQNKEDLTFPVNVNICLIRYTVSNRSDFNGKRPRVNSAATNLWSNNAVLHESVLSTCIHSACHTSPGKVFVNTVYLTSVWSGRPETLILGDLPCLPYTPLNLGHNHTLIRTLINLLPPGSDVHRHTHTCAHTRI